MSRPIKSIFMDGYYYDNNIWVVSLVNTAKGFGHSAIYVEGLENDGSKYKSRFDIHAKTSRSCCCCFQRYGYIDEIKIYESPHKDIGENQNIVDDAFNAGSAKDYSAKSFKADPDLVKKMINNIKNEKQEFLKIKNNNIEKLRTEFPFKLIKFYWSSGETDNCSSWCKKHLAIAGVDTIGKKPKISNFERARNFLCG